MHALLLKIILLAFIVIGIGFLSGGLRYNLIIIKILRRDKKWIALLGLIIMFLVGYIFFAYSLFISVDVSRLATVSLIYFFGALFVFFVMKISFSTVSGLLKIDKLKKMALTDRLTGIHNRHYIDESFIDAGRGSSFCSKDIGVLMIDIDDFKQINDTYGHPVGDCVLRNVATLLKSQIRSTDVIGRYGGEEFIVILSGSNIENAEIIGEKLRVTIADFNFIAASNEGRETSLKVTVSIGVSHRQVGQVICPKELVSQADSSLYQAKDKGKNRVITYLRA